MVLGALVDAGLPLKHLRSKLALLKLGSYELTRSKSKGPLAGTNIHVIAKGLPHAADYKGIDAMIARSRLPRPVRTVSRTIFERLARAEARVHGTSIDKVHFHEVGAIDSIVDVVGSAIGFEYFKFASIYSSPIPMSRGFVKSSHGHLPVPAPAALEILKGVSLEPSRVRREIVTPTGAAILATVCESFGDCPLQTIEGVGYGFGDRVIPGIPNALRLMIGEGFKTVVIETDIDDMNPQLFEYAMEQILKAGAKDVNLLPIQMKKARPGIRLSAIVPWEQKECVINAILKETTSFGVRYWPIERKVLVRELVKKKVSCGRLTFKIGCDSSGKIIKAMPEYDGIRKLARKRKRPLVEVYQEALALAGKLSKRSY